jgi:diguanylate cyclase (GGDEF)-like protein
MLCIIHDITEEVHLKEELEFAATHDPLTGLLNRREFYRIVDSSLFHSGGFCLLLVDVDNFKAINDSYGHQKGDEVLLAISRILESAAKIQDKIYRWGGEEFIISPRRVNRTGAGDGRSDSPRGQLLSSPSMPVR